ncbi:P-loop containing nucleoside triphosphate hydrolase protein [Lipomyces kononenkoae]|uniref:P-loop containing nucleoside triphosphate hydrolase protein n=1 Tax=Lipomyces kononenkoae TaxID=34357 RepID=A0ACC3T381_LIPKO
MAAALEVEHIRSDSSADIHLQALPLQDVSTTFSSQPHLTAQKLSSGGKRKRNGKFGSRSRTSSTECINGFNGSVAECPRPPKRQRSKTEDEIQREIDIATVLNDLNRLAPIGVIDIYNLPRLPAPGLEAPDGWLWIEPPWEKSVVLEEPLSSLAYLHKRMFLRVTYRMLDHRTARFRIYIVPKDVEGRRFLPPMPTLTKKRIRNVMLLMNTSGTAWDGDRDAPMVPLIKPPPDEAPTLFDMFNQISAVPESVPEIDDPESEEIINEVMTGHVEGMKSVLYLYQRETVAEMIRKELLPVQMIDPRLSEIMSPQGKKLYMDTDTYEVHLKPDYFDGTFGGVLSEEMGFGKTCICIALICATKYQGSRVPDDCLFIPTEQTSVSSLSSICARTINSLGLPWRTYRSSLPDKCIELLTQNRASYVVEDRRSSHTRAGTRGNERVKPQTIILSGTTLVICPDALVHQWLSELEKHVIKGFLNVLSFNGYDCGSNVDFSSFDVVLMSQRRFALEFRQPSSPLLQVRWKRIIVDEGHSMGNSQTNAAFAAKQLFVDRKWAVTGTPVPGLLGINVGLDAAMTSASPSTEAKVGNQHSRVATDLLRLGHIVADFLCLPPWRDNSSLWQKYCAGPFLDEKRHEIVQRVLRQVMVRHRWKDLQIDVELPPLTHEVVLLEPSTFNKININLFHAFVAVNAVSSDRTDQDYLFHRNNRAQLRRLVTNLQHSTFYWTGFSIDDVEFMMDVAKNCLTNGKSYTEHDIHLLKRSIEAGKYALNNASWKFSSQQHEMGFFVSQVPEVVPRQVFDLLLSPNAGIMSGPKILRFQQLVRDIKVRDVDGNIGDEQIIKLLHALEADSGLLAELVRPRPLPTRSPSKSKTLETEPKLRGLPGLPSTPLMTSQHANTPGGKSYKFFSYSDGFINASTVKIQSNSRFRQSTIYGCLSSKLSYLLSRVLELCMDEKIIVFYEFDDIAFYLGEGLEIFGIEHCFYTTSLNPQARASNLMAFNTASKFRVMLMDLGLAAHGLNVTGASRIFFVNPVWQPNIEAQAMRRAHRIGQTRPVHVETLILRGTIEEELFNRRRNMTEADFAAAKTLTDDAPTSRIISASHFMEIDDLNPHGQPFKPPVPILKADGD